MAKSETILSILLILVTLSIASVGSISYFNDVETATGNVLMGGILDLTVNGQNNPITGQFTVGKMKPGDIEYALFTLKNVGNLNGILSIKIKNLVNYENGLEEPETTAGDTGEPGELGEQCYLKIFHDINDNGKFDSGEYTWPDWPFGSTKVLNEIPLDTNLFAAYTMVAGSEHPIMFRILFKSSGSNDLAMGDSVVFDIEFKLSQVV